MAAITVIVQFSAEKLLAIFVPGSGGDCAGRRFLRLMAWNIHRAKLVYICTSMFSGTRKYSPLSAELVGVNVSFIIQIAPLFPKEFSIEQVWYLLVASTLLHSVVSLLLLTTEFQEAPLASPLALLEPTCPCLRAPVILEVLLKQWRHHALEILPAALPKILVAAPHMYVDH